MISWPSPSGRPTRVYLANAHDIRTAIAFIHGVTSPAAPGNIARVTSDRTARGALRYAWQSGCALYACYGGETAAIDRVNRGEEDEDELIDRAVAHGDEHIIKFTGMFEPTHSRPLAGLLRRRQPRARHDPAPLKASGTPLLARWHAGR
jgi:hypothetical protein